MDAVISGRAGKALLLDGDSLKSFDVDDPSKLVSRHQSDLPYLFGETQDLRVIKNTDIEAVRHELKHDCDCSWALDLALIAFDVELPDEIREEAIEGLDELLADSEVVERLENIFYARPLPDDADLAGALNLCGEARFSNTLALLQRFQERQQLIHEVSEAWDIIPTKIFGGYEQQAEFQHVAVRAGLFRALVIILESQRNALSLHATSGQLVHTNPNNSIPMFLLNAGLNDSIKGLRNYRQVLQSWASPFRQSGDAPQIKPESEEADESGRPTRRRHGRRFGIDRAAVLREVNRKKAVILATMKGRDIGSARELIDELVRYQINNSEPEHTAKSLCDLAIGAKELGINTLRLELTERSITIAPDDYWSWAQYGDALLSMQRLDAALNAYQQSEDFGAGVLARTGKAEALKAMSRLDEALTAFDEVILEYPEDVVAKTGRAEVLKAMGRLDEALIAFDEIILEHSENAFAKNGRAEVLKAMGQLDEALVAFDEVILEHPEDVVAKTGRAEVLKAMGRLDEALIAFDEIIFEHPEDVVAKAGRAEVLKAMGQLDEALVAFDEIILEHSENVVAKAGRAEVLKAMGKFDAALSAYSEVILKHPEDVVAKNGRAEVLKAMGQLDEALVAFDEVILEHPEDVVAKNGRAEVLKAMGRLDEALIAYNETILKHPEDVVAKAGRAEVLKAMGKFDAALSAYSEVILEYPDNGIAIRGRSCVLAALGRYDEALLYLPDQKNPSTLDDWIGYHIRGMILLRTGKISAAIQILNNGALNTPWSSQREYFRSALAVAWLRRGDFKKASQALEEVNSPLLQPAANVLRLHAFGARGEWQFATTAYESLATKPQFLSNELTQELHHQFILREAARHDEDWIFDREVKIFLLAA